MEKTFKELTAYFQEVGADQVEHTDKGYLAHAIGVYNDLKKWGCEEELAWVGLFHSIYGTQIFQGFTLPVERRSEIRDLIGQRAERISYYNCAIDREHFDKEILKPDGPYTILDRFTGAETPVADQDFHDLCVVHLCDWLEQVARWKNWGYRREGYRALAHRLGGVALQSYERVFANEPQSV